MSRKKFEIIYPDRSRKHVDAETKEQMLLSGELRPTSKPSVFVCTAPLLRFTSFADMQQLLARVADKSVKRRYLGLSLTFELRGRRYRENQMTPEGMAASLARP